MANWTSYVLRAFLRCNMARYLPDTRLNLLLWQKANDQLRQPFNSGKLSGRTKDVYHP